MTSGCIEYHTIFLSSGGIECHTIFLSSGGIECHTIWISVSVLLRGNVVLIISKCPNTVKPV
jgi:hypothetical protein